jgi:predicted PurR-regulated permease PerM
MKTTNSHTIPITKMITRLVIAVGFILLIYFLRASIMATLIPVIVAGVIALLLSPLISFLNKHIRIRKENIKNLISILLAYLLFAAVMTAIVLFLIPILSDSFERINRSLPDIFRGLSEKFKEFEAGLHAIGISGNISESFGNMVNNLPAVLNGAMDNIAPILNDTLTILLAILLGVYFSFYFIKDGEQMMASFFKIIPSSKRTCVRESLHQVYTQLKGFMRGQLLIALISMAGSIAGYLIIGLEFALPLGVIMGAFCLIPYLGPFIGAVPALLIALLYAQTFLLVLLVILLVQVIVAVLAPRIMGDKLGFHPVGIMLGMLFFGNWLGFFGMLFSIPILIIIRGIIQLCIQLRRSYKAEQLNYQ